MRKELPLFLGSAVCLLMLCAFFLNVPILQRLATDAQDWVIVMSACALGLGATSLVLRHANIVQRKGANWAYSVVVLAGMLVFPLASFLEGGIRSRAFLFVYDRLFAPISATLFSILVFYTASAAYRTFRLKNAQAAVLLFSGVLLMIGKVPIGNVIWPGFTSISTWIMQIPVASTNRGILIGGAIATMSAGIRYLVGMERMGQDADS